MQRPPAFSSARMLREYVEGLYRPAAADYRARVADDAREARALAAKRVALHHTPAVESLGETVHCDRRLIRLTEPVQCDVLEFLRLAESDSEAAASIDSAQTVVWNGPMGVFETPPFDRATVALARTAAALTQSGSLVSVAGGGDTVAALNHAGVADQFTFVSTAGGAFLEWMEGKALPGVEALKR